MSLNQFEQLFAKMRARAHRPTGAGVEFLPHELIERAKPTHQGIGSLASDMRTSLLREDATEPQTELAHDFFRLAGAWVEFYKQISNKDTVHNAAEAIDEFDRRYRQAILAYQQLGFRPSYQPPISYYDDLSAKAANYEPKPIPVAKLLAVSGGAIAIFWYFQRNRNRNISDLQPIRVGPPQLAPAPEKTQEQDARLTERTG